MRPIKYRCFNKKTKEITENIWSINLCHNGVVIWKESYEEDGSSTIQYETLFGYKDEFELMQFTGLHDKNRKEIYEGDIIKPKYGNEVYTINDLLHFGFNYYEYFMSEENIEILGNIHENPELLENK